ncbi:MAG: hypothetical protein V3T86_17585 [Planctomycetota bacterium]
MKTLWKLLAVAMPMIGVLPGCGAGDNETPASNDPKEIALVRVEPSAGESSVARNRRVRLTFSGDVLPESVHDQSVRIRFGPTFGTRPVGTFLVSGNVVEFDPTVLPGGSENAAGFPAAEQILVEVPLNIPDDPEPAVNFVQNVEGNPVATAANNNSLTFTTGDGWNDAVPGPPGVLGIDFVPAANSFGQVSPDAAVTVVFSEPVDPQSVRLGDNIFLTNNSPTAPTFQEGIVSEMFVDGSLRRYTFQPVFGFGQGPFNIAVNFINPADPASFDPVLLPTDLVGNQLQNFTFLGTFDTQFDPVAVNNDTIREDFTTLNNLDQPNTTAIWATDGEIPFALVSAPITTRTTRITTASLLASGATTSIGGGCTGASSLVGSDVTIPVGYPPSVLGRRVMNLYRQAEMGPNGSIVRAAWGPGNDVTSASTYPGVIVRLGHKTAGTGFAEGLMDDQYDVEGAGVTVAVTDSYRVVQSNDVNGNGIPNDGWVDWPEFERFFEYNGSDDLILDVEVMEGTASNPNRRFFATSGPCSCGALGFGQAGCSYNTSMGVRSMRSVFGGQTNVPVNDPFSTTPAVNPVPAVDNAEFEIAITQSIGRSTWYDSGQLDPQYVTFIRTPVIQPGGAVVTFEFAGSLDGLMDSTGLTTDIRAISGFRYIRFEATMKAAFATSARARVNLLDIPFSYE